MKRALHIITSIAMAIALLAVATVPAAAAEPAPLMEEETEVGAIWFAPLVILAIVNVGLAAYVILDAMDDDDGGIGTPDETGRQMEADIAIEMLSINGELLSHNLHGFTDVWRFTNTYWMRQAEVAAAESWSTAAYSAQALVERAGLYVNTAQLMRNINEGPDAAFAQLNNRMALWQTVDGFEQMSIRLQHGSSHTTYADGLDLHIRPTVSATATADKAYLTGDDLWAISAGTATAEDGTKISLTQGHNDMSHVAPGVYQLTSGDYAGGILPAIVWDAAPVTAGIVITSPDNVQLAVRDGDGVRIGNNQYPSLRLAVHTGSVTSDPMDLLPLLRHYDNTIAAVEDSIVRAASAARAAWSVYDAAGEANILLSPSSLVPQLEDIDVSAEQMAVLTTLYLRQVHDYYQRVQGNLDATGWALSPDSIDMYMRGDVYDTTGTLLYESVVMTPYIWLEDWSIGREVVTARQSGIIAIWGETDDLATWEGAQSGQDAQIIALEPGYMLDVRQIVHHGEQVDSVALTIMEIEEWDPIVIPKPHQPPALYNIDGLIQVIGILIGVLIALIGIATGRYELIVIGGIVAVVIVVWPGMIRGLL